MEEILELTDNKDYITIKQIKEVVKQGLDNSFNKEKTINDLIVWLKGQIQRDETTI